ncbi:MAG: hypothetical protein R8G66_28870 [Cytophagales bacterium]|nr:hypothetical protein [Cytophagales bacterium]
MKNLLILLSFLCLMSCESYSQTTQIDPVDNKLFNDYWYAGEAELTSYSLQQARYGEIHEGHAVLVFVTEPFSASKQVKLDYPGRAGDDNVSVLKLNFTKKFITGIYPYSMMSSVFTPISYDKYPNTLKVSTSSQEWCGHTFMQLNLEKNHYALTGLSYFESEGDVNEKLDKVYLEDELWTKIRINPATLPTGSFKIVPGTFHLRLKHIEAGSKIARGNLVVMDKSAFSESKHHKYSLKYDDRSLDIYFERNFPFQILGWEETARGLTTTAVRKESLKSPYWQKNSNADRALRKQLGL